MGIDATLFRDVMASFPAGVTVVTALGEDGEVRGLTVSAFCPVSLTPPLVLVCVDKGSNTLPAIRARGAFTVNFLAAGREDLALRLASKGAAKFEGMRWVPPDLPGAGPVLADDGCASCSCLVRTAIEAGDHWIFVGEVEEGRLWEDRAPLLYCRRSFATWTDPSAAAPGGGR